MNSVGAKKKFENWIYDSAADSVTVKDILEREAPIDACWIGFWEGWKAALEAAPTPPAGKIVVTTDQSGNAVAVTRQDEEGRVISVIWEAPTPPAQEAEPVLYQYRSHYCEEWLPCRKDQVDALRSHGGKVRALYTHPDNSELRKAAEDALLILRCLSVDKNLTESWRDKADRAANGLSAALDIAKLNDPPTR